MAVLLIGTLDTKGVEFAFLRDLLRTAGVDVLVLDAGVLRPPAFPPTCRAKKCSPRPVRSLEALRKAGDRGRAVEAAASGAAARRPATCTARAASTAFSAWAARPARPSARPPCAPCRSACPS